MRSFKQSYYYNGSLYYLNKLLIRDWGFKRRGRKWEIKDQEIDDYLVNGHISVSKLRDVFELSVEIHAVPTEDWTDSWDDVFEEYTHDLFDMIKGAECESERRNLIGQNPAMSNEEMWELFNHKTFEE